MQINRGEPDEFDADDDDRERDDTTKKKQKQKKKKKDERMEALPVDERRRRMTAKEAKARFENIQRHDLFSFYGELMNRSELINADDDDDDDAGLTSRFVDLH